MSDTRIFGTETNKREAYRMLVVDHGDSYLTVTAIPEGFLGGIPSISVMLMPKEARELAADLIRRAAEIEQLKGSIQ